jgi:hypothetical protein
MAALEDITRGAVVRGILPNSLATISDVRWIGTVAIEVTYKDASGGLAYKRRPRLRKTLQHNNPQSKIQMARFWILAFGFSIAPGDWGTADWGLQV